MNEAEEVLHDFKQALAQIVFYHLSQLKRVFTDDDAVSIISEELKKIEEMFSDTSPSSLFSLLVNLETTWSEKHKVYASNQDYDNVMHAEQVLNAIKVLKSATEDNV